MSNRKIIEGSDCEYECIFVELTIQSQHIYFKHNIFDACKCATGKKAKNLNLHRNEFWLKIRENVIFCVSLPES